MNVHIKERIALLDRVVELYINNQEEEEKLANLNWILGEAISRLWSHKHKELGRFAGTLFKLVENIVDKVCWDLLLRTTFISSKPWSSPFANKWRSIKKKPPSSSQPSTRKFIKNWPWGPPKVSQTSNPNSHPNDSNTSKLFIISSLMVRKQSVSNWQPTTFSQS